MGIILFAGGGSAGHVVPNLALIARCQKEGWIIHYAGTAQGIERDIIRRLPDVTYHAVSSGKLRRYFSWQNFIDPFNIAWGLVQSWWLCLRLKPDVLFSKGGFVSFPVVVGAWLNCIPVIIHESDMTPGLANRLSAPFAQHICVSFEKSVTYYKKAEKLVVTGNPIRDDFLRGDADKGRALCQFTNDKPVVLVMGGSLGADALNTVVRDALKILLETYQVAHICGPEKTRAAFDGQPGYRQFEYLNDELPDVMACADVVISRSGANALYELLALKKPHILVPLSKISSRGDQIHNANYSKEKGFSKVLPQETLTPTTLLETLAELEQDLPNIRERLSAYQLPDSVEMIYALLQEGR